MACLLHGAIFANQWERNFAGLQAIGGAGFCRHWRYQRSGGIIPLDVIL